MTLASTNSSEPRQKTALPVLLSSIEDVTVMTAGARSMLA
jgi:hypothetical protein